jgi:UDP-GlcNAc:undecaprenyl-phosphate GlcNAc-1-phosphate transferase
MVGVAAAFAIALGWSVLAIWLGPRIGLVDSPTASMLKVHSKPIPLLGGVGVFAGVHLGMLIEGAFEPALFAATLAVLILGLVDDVVALSPKVRLAVELASSVFLVVMIDPGTPSVVWIVAGVALMLIAINAVNLLDGLDGLVASVTVVSGLGLAWAGTAGWGSQEFGLTIAAAVTGFLIVNWQPARVFLGDNGAYVIGMILAYGVLAGGGGDAGISVLLTIGALGVFLIDLVATITRRALNGTPVFAGDRSHIYDRLRDRGWSVRTVALFAAGIQAALVLVSIGIIVA